MITTIEDSCHLSPVQHGMLFHHLSGAHSGVDIEQIVVDYPEALDPAALRSAWDTEVSRQPVLRTGFVWKDTPEPVQEIHSTVSLEFRVHDWTAQTDPDHAFEQFLLEDRRRGFDIAEPPLLRVALFRFGAEHWRMAWTFHHILIDGRSFVAILQEVEALYEQIRHGEAPTTEPVPFADYKQFVEWLHGYDHSQARDFWREHLKGFTAPTPLPVDLEAAGGDMQRYGEQERRLSLEASNNLRRLAEETGVTLNTVFMGAWALLLARYSAESDIVFGATKTGRRGSTALGLFLNTIPVRIYAGRERTVADYLKDLRAQWIKLRTHEYTPLVDIKEASELPASSPIFDTLVVFENERFDSVLAGTGGKWPTRRCRLLEQTNYTFSFIVYGNPEILVKLEYDARRYTAPMITRLLGHVECILASMAADSQATLGTLNMLTSEERQTILYEWNRTETDYPRDVLVPDAIARVAAASPDRTAVIFRETTVTYGELNRRAALLAHYLHSRGIRPGMLVGIHVERSVETLVALLGVMKSGAGYVPLDPAFPPDRLAFMAEDSALGALIAQKGTGTALAPNAVRIEIDTDWPAIAAGPTDDFPCPASPADVSYVLYTSGSTGKPKGVQLSHRALANFEYSMMREPGMCADDITLAITTVSFDIAAYEIYVTLMAGATLVLAPKEVALDMHRLASMVREYNVTFLQGTPATWQMLFDSGWEGKPGMKMVTGGDWLSRDLANRMLRTGGELWNNYGPTETTIYSTARRLTSEEAPIVLGRGIANTTLYLLDESRNPVPVGVAGEIYIGGDGVADGYLNRPDLTQERFFPDPFRPGAGNVYKSGDLGRWWPNGEVECLGRNDFQVKIRGFRIELGEVEAALRDHPAVRQSVVVVRQDQLGKRLVGYLIPRGDQRPSPADFKIFLSPRLPEYMIPAQYVFLESYPLTPNGKVNRLALPTPDPATSTAESTYAAPRDDFERQLCKAWAEVLRLERVGIHDNFFELGGHSLLAVQLAVRVQKLLPGEQLPLSALLDAPTVERFAAWLRARTSSEFQHLVRMRPGSPSRPPFFCVHGAGGNVLSMRTLAMALPDDLPFYSLQAKGLDGSEPFYSVEEAARCYVEEIRKVQPHGPYHLGGGCFGGIVAFEMARILEQRGEPVASLLMMDSYNFAFGKFLPRHELIARNVWFYLRRAAFHARKLSSVRPGDWPRYLAGRFRTLRKHASDLAGMVGGETSSQYPLDPNQVEIEGAEGTALGETLKRVRQAGLIAASKFVPQPYGGRAVIFRASKRGYVEPYEDDYLGWRPVVRGGIEAFEIEGDHDSIFDQPDVKAMAKIVNAKLLEADSPRAAAAMR